jgi:dTDP-glucose 4,6-dehydratase
MTLSHAACSPEKTILVTGGAGFLGSNFVRHIYTRHPTYRIIAVDALTYAGSIDNLPLDLNGAYDGRLTFWHGNVCNANLMEALIAQSDIVVHFAAETHVTRSIYDNLQFFQTDVIGTQTVMNAVLKNLGRIERVLHISTSEVYGTALTPDMTEDHPLNPMSPYASAKCGADRLVYSYWSTYRLPAVIVRPFNNFGPRQHLEKLVPRLITSVILREALTIHGDGSAARDYLYVDDTSRAIDLLMHAPIESVMGEVFNVASGQHREIRQIANDVMRIMRADSAQIVHLGNRPGQVLRHTGNWQRIYRLLDWKPEIDWETGLQRTVDWFRNNTDWWRKQIWMRRVSINTASGEIEMH